jgi:hypothetical protein
LEGWEEVLDPADPRSPAVDRIMKFIFDGTYDFGNEGFDSARKPHGKAWATRFRDEYNYNAIKIESEDRKYSKVYDLSGDNVEIDGKEVDMTKEQQLNHYLKNDFFLKYQPTADGAKENFAAYKKKIMDAKGFSVYINNVATGKRNLGIIEYDRAFHVETYTFDMEEHSTFDAQQIARQDYETTAEDRKKWEAFIKKIKQNIQNKDRKEYYAVHIDKWVGNSVRPILKCKSPCYNCFDSDPTFCTSCWGLGEQLKDSKGKDLPLNSRLYLQPRSVTRNVGGTPTVARVSTCADKCDAGFSVNGEAVGVKMEVVGDPKRGLKRRSINEVKLTDPPAADDEDNTKLREKAGELDGAGGLSIWDEVDLKQYYFKCQQCDQTCLACRGEKATGGPDPYDMFKKIGWVEDKS